MSEVATKSILDEHLHARLIAEMPLVCATAGVPSKYVRESAVGNLHPNALAWVKRYPRNKAEGVSLMIEGVHNSAAKIWEYLAKCRLSRRRSRER